MPAEAVSARTTKDAQHVVLSGGEAEATKILRHLMLEVGGGPHDCEQHLFAQALERLALLDGGFDSPGHSDMDVTCDHTHCQAAKARHTIGILNTFTKEP